MIIKIGQFFDIMEPKSPTPPLAVPEASETKETLATNAPQKSKTVKSSQSSPGETVAEDPKTPPPEASAPKPPETAETEGKKPTTLDVSPQTYYQAIGWLRGRLTQKEERFYLEVRDRAFPLYMARRLFSFARNHLNQMLWVKCYPQSKGEGLSFRVVWMGTEQHEENCEAGIFVLRGVWQFIPQCRRPVFSIYRNQLKDYESRPNNQHLPLIWADQPPYRFRKDSEDKPKFYQILARLIPQRECFGFVSQIADPIDKTPRRVKKTPPGAEGKEAKGGSKEGKPTKDKSGFKAKGKAKLEATEAPPATPEGQTPGAEAAVVETPPKIPDTAPAVVTPPVDQETVKETKPEAVSTATKATKKAVQAETPPEVIPAVPTVTASPTTTEVAPKSSGEASPEAVESPKEVTPEEPPKTGKKIRLVPSSKKAEVSPPPPAPEPETVVTPPTEETPKKTRAKSTKTKKAEATEPVADGTETAPKKTRAKTTRAKKAETGEPEA